MFVTEAHSGTSSTDSLTSTLDIPGMITKLSRDQKDTLVQDLKRVLSKHLGNAIDDTVDRPSGARIFGLDGSQFEVLTSLKEVFLNTPLFVDDIVNDFQNEYSKVAKGENFTYTLAQLRNIFSWKKDICTTTPRLDPIVLEQLNKAAESDRDYVIGFELDQMETNKLGQLVFAIFEKNGIMEISRVQTLASELERG